MMVRTGILGGPYQAASPGGFPDPPRQARPGEEGSRGGGFAPAPPVHSERGRRGITRPLSDRDEREGRGITEGAFNALLAQMGVPE